MRKIFLLLTFFMLFINVFYALADDTCNCKDLLVRIEKLESIIYQNTDDTSDTGSKYSTGTQTSSSYQNANNNSDLSTKTAKPIPAQISYISVSAKQLEDDLSQNAAKAKQMYEGNYYEVTGFIQTIDASGKYFSLRSESAWISNITFDVKNDEQKQYLINNFNRDQKVTVKGKCKNVGEVLGYRFDWQ